MPSIPLQSATRSEGLSLIGWASERTERELCAFFGRKGGVAVTPRLHLTLMAHEGQWPKGIGEREIAQAIPPLLEARLEGLQLWRRPGVQKNRWIIFAQDFLVAPLHAPQAQAAHEKLVDMGFSHQYGDFVAHLTIARSQGPMAFSEQFLEEYGRFIEKQRLVASFSEWEARPLRVSPLAQPAEPLAGHPAAHPLPAPRARIVQEPLAANPEPVAAPGRRQKRVSM
jgi:2'-5' RNA ligase